MSEESFAAFMARALHDPERGYYARRTRGIGGTRGDFATAATLSPLLGQAVAAWLKKTQACMPKVRHVIEVGAGNGMLMQTVRKSLGWWRRRRLAWHIVETSVPLREQQRQRLGDGVHWHTSLEAALQASGGQAFIYHNELLDAFPARLVQQQEDDWQEVFLSHENGITRECLRPLGLTLGERSDFSALTHAAFRKGQRVELHASVRDWLHTWTPHWQQGAMLTIDYGELLPSLYHRRPGGTVRAYLMHQRLEGPAVYENIGRQDITADINFTDYRSWTAACGMKEAFFGSQAEFIRLHQPEARGPMVDPEGAGGSFKALVHEKT
jgi:SAM-dependent MidA family methyltransferase